MNNPTLAQVNYSRVIVTTMKDETPYILDWLSYHMAIGFTHFIVLTNDCSDGTEKLLRNLEKIGILTHKNNPAPHPRGPQKNGYLRMRKLEAFQQADWLLSLDVDEYFRIDVGDGHLDDLFAFVGDQVDAISFVWQLFGHNNVKNIIDSPIVEQFTKCGPELQARPYEAMPIKTLYRGGIFAKIGTHRPKDPASDKKANFLWIDANGVPLPQYLSQQHWRSYPNGMGFGTALGRINHYALRSMDAFMVKWRRGFVHPTAPTVRGQGTPMDYWRLFDWNLRDETRITRIGKRAAALKDALTSDKKILRLHNNGLDWHLERAAQLHGEQPEIFDELEEIKNTSLSVTMPDFSQHGSPEIYDTEVVPLDVLKRVSKHSILPPSFIAQKLDQLRE